MFGNESVLMKPFKGKNVCTNRFHIFKDQDSVDARHERVRGIGNIQQTEWLSMVTASPMTLPPKKYNTYHGGTGGNVIGPVVLQSANMQWNTTWSEKKTHLRKRELHRGRRQAGRGRPRTQAQKTTYR